MLHLRHDCDNVSPMSSNLVSQPSRALSETIAGGDRTSVRPTPSGALERAREVFRAGDKLDMGSLAGDLGVARATLYRWTGDRSRLLGDVAWLEVKAVVDHVAATSPGTGTAYIERAAGALLSILADSAPLRSFLEREGDEGLQLLTAPNGALRPRLVAAVSEVIDGQVAAGAYRSPVDPQVLADAIVALGERFLYHGGDPALNPDPETARQAIALLLREPCR